MTPMEILALILAIDAILATVHITRAVRRRPRLVKALSIVGKASLMVGVAIATALYWTGVAIVALGQWMIEEVA